MASGLTTQDQSIFAQALYAALAGSFGLGLFTYALAPVTGAHLSKRSEIYFRGGGLLTIS